MNRLATSYSTDVQRLLNALGITTRHVTAVDIALRVNNIVVVTVEHAMTEDALAALADELERAPLRAAEPSS